MKMNDFADAGKTNPIKPNFKGKKMLLRTSFVSFAFRTSLSSETQDIVTKL